MMNQVHRLQMGDQVRGRSAVKVEAFNGRRSGFYDTAIIIGDGRKAGGKPPLSHG